MKSICKFCFFALFLFFSLPLFSSGQVVINEIAWMGTTESANNEWMELRNSGSASIDLTGWTLFSQDGTPTINLLGGVAAGGFFLLERTDDNTLPSIIADQIYTGALSNSGEKLVLKNAAGEIVDEINGSDNWKISGVETIGNNTTKETAQRTSSGNWITAVSTPKSANSGSANSNQSSQENQSQSQSNQTSTNQLPIEEKLPTLIVNAGEDKIALSGQNIVFKAIAYGLEEKPLENAYYLWNFGDGSVKKGNPVSYIYKYPGEYKVVLSVSSGILTGSDESKIKIIQPSLEISELKPGENGYLEIHNYSSFDLDISGLGISDAKNYFYFPENTKISANVFLAIGVEISKISFPPADKATLISSNGVEIASFAYGGEIGENQSFHNIDNQTKIGLKSPGSAEFKIQQSSLVASGINKSTAEDTAKKTAEIAKTTEKIATSSPENVVSQNTANVSNVLFQQEKGTTSSLYFWVGLTALLGILSAIILFFLWKL